MNQVQTWNFEVQSKLEVILMHFELTLDFPLYSLHLSPRP
jgi:hypothetical protein